MFKKDSSTITESGLELANSALSSADSVLDSANSSVDLAKFVRWVWAYLLLNSLGYQSSLVLVLAN